MRRCASRGPLGRIGLGDAERQHAAGRERAHLLEPVGAVDDRPDVDGVDMDALLHVVAVPAPDGNDRPALANAGEHAAREQCRVVHGIHAAGRSLEHGLDHPVSTREHDVGAEAAHELLVLGFRVSEHAEPAMLCDPDHVRRQQPGAAGHGERLALRQPERLETADRGQCVHRQRRGLLRGSHPRGSGRPIPRARRAAPSGRRPRGATARRSPSPRRRPPGRRPRARWTRRRRRSPTRPPRVEALPRRLAAGARCRTGAPAAAFTASLTSPGSGSGISRSMTRHDLGPARSA